MKNKRSSIVTTKDYDMVVNLLQKKEKSQRDLETIFNKISLLNGFNMFIQNYFQGSDISEQIKICGELFYEKKNKGDIIFQQDEASNNKLYIILKGSCMVFLMKDLDFQEEEEQPNNQAHNQNNKSLTHIPDINEKEIKKVSLTIIDRLKKIGQKFKKSISLDFDKSTLTSSEIADYKRRYGKTTRLLQAGSIFGERALLTNQPRTATIIADSHPTELVILDRDKFLPALEELKRTLQLRRDILFQIFKDMDNYSSARLESMLYTFSVISFNRGQYITEQDQKDDKIYIIAEGEAQILKKITIQVNENHSEEKFAKLTIIGPGVMVGDEIMLKGDQKYLYTTEVISLKAQVLVADKKIIDRKFPKDLKEYFKKISINKEKGRLILLDHKEEEIRNEIIIQMKKESNKRLMQSQNYKNRSEEKTNEMLKKFKEAINARSNLSDFQQQNQNQNQDDQIPSQKEILRGVIPQQKQIQQEYFQSSMVFPNINEKSTTNFKDDYQPSSISMRGIKESLLGQSGNIFDVKSQVFDFGDGKNIQNAQRIEKILNAKNKKRKEPHFYGNALNLQQQIEKNVTKQKQSEFHIQNIINDMQNIQSFVKDRNNGYSSLGSESNSNRLLFDQHKNQQDFNNLIQKEGSQTQKHTRNSSENILNLNLSINNTFGNNISNSEIFTKAKQQLPNIKIDHNAKKAEQKQQQLQLLQQAQSLAIIHSSKHKQGNDEHLNKLIIKKPFVKVTVNSSQYNKSNSQFNFDAQVLGALHLSPKRVQKFQVESLEKLQKKNKKLLLSSKSHPTPEEIELVNQMNRQNYNPSLGILTLDDENNSIIDNQSSLIVPSQKEDNKEDLNEFQNGYKTNQLSGTTSSTNVPTSSKQYNTLIHLKINEKIQELDTLNSQDNNIKREINGQEQIFINNINQIQTREDSKEVNTPIRRNIIAKNGIEYPSEPNTQPSSQNKNLNIIVNRNAGGFFPLTVSKPNKVLNHSNNTFRTQSVKKIIPLKDQLNNVSIFRKQNTTSNSSLNKFQNAQNELYSLNNNNQLGEYFNVINYNKIKPQNNNKVSTKLPFVQNS